MPGRLDDPDLLPVQLHPAAVREVRPAEEAGAGIYKQGFVAARVVGVVMGIGGIEQGEPAPREQGEDHPPRRRRSPCRRLLRKPDNQGYRAN